MLRVLFVCLGNICRSPTAEGWFGKVVIDAGLTHQVEIDSAGTGAWHVGNAPDPRAQVAVARHGISIAHLRARAVQPDDFETFDYILAMDEENLMALMTACPSQHAHKVQLFLDYASDDAGDAVPDPYYGGDDGFARVVELIAEASDGLLADVRDRLAV
ncbi:MAG: low molecular weight protein-tyrosine-phosphatase [Pseudomonadota bacterium]